MTLDPGQWAFAILAAILVGVSKTGIGGLGLLAVAGLVLKDRCLRSPAALVVDAVVAAPALAAIALLLEPFLIPVE